MTTFAERLSMAITEDGRTRGEIATACGTSTAQLLKWERGEASPRLNSIRGLCTGLGITERWLTSGLGEKSAEKQKENAMKAEAEKKFHSARVTNGKDKRQLEDLNLVINHIRDMNLSSDEMKAIYITLSELRNEVEARTLFNGMTA